MENSVNGLYLVKHIRECERRAIVELKIPEDELMLRAGTAAFATLQSMFPQVKSIAVICGGGSNAGDGYVLARLAYENGLAVHVYYSKAPEDLPPAAYKAYHAAQHAGVLCQYWDDGIEGEVELIVDALLGIGVQGEVRGPTQQIINQLNESGIPILSLDIPSGLDANTGNIFGSCIKAAVTVTFIAPKIGLYTSDGPDQAGRVVCHSLEIDTCLSTVQPAAYRLNPLSFTSPGNRRKKNSNKSMFGHVLIIGGNFGMPGAVCLAALGALRVGAGLVSVATRPEHVSGLIAKIPEALLHGIERVDDLIPLLSKATVCVLGPGLGEDLWARELYAAAVSAQLPLVLDASALRLLAQNPQYDDNWVLTPHPGEAASLLNCTTNEIQSDRRKSARRIQEHFGGCVVVKGVGTIIQTLEIETYLCTGGNPGMASAGMGDVLSGIIGGLLAQEFSLSNAATIGVWLHATAGDQAAAKGERGLIATDLIPFIPPLLNSIL